MRHPATFITAMVLIAVGLLGLLWLRVASDAGLSRPPRYEQQQDRPGGPPDSRNEWGGPPGSDEQTGADENGDRLPPDDPLAGVELGERIYRYGVGEAGQVPRTAIGPGMMGGGCVNCHGADGRGGRIEMMMFSAEVPDIRLDALQEGNDGARWTDDDVLRAIVEGVEPDGEPLDELMPRWRLSRTEAQALIDYLGELSER